MEYDNQEILGKKVFFLYPPTLIQEEILFELSTREYEVYQLSNHEKAKSILRQYPQSVCFINVDTILSDTAWRSYIANFCMDSSLKTTRVGIITNGNSAELKKTFAPMDLQCGIISVKKGKMDCLKEILTQLEAQGAKGRRKYVRAYCEKDPLANINFTNEISRKTLKIRDISSVGLSCYSADGAIEGVKKNMLLRDIQLSLHGTLIHCQVVVFAINERSEENSYVLLFTKEIDDISRDKIRAYIRNYLQSVIDVSVKE